jgi:hypothetical protein
MDDRLGPPLPGRRRTCPRRAPAGIAALITETVITHGIDFDGDAVSVYASTIGYRIMDALRDAELTITRRR